MKKLTTLEYVTKAKTVHGNKYDYSLVIYNGRRGKIKIICPKHGELARLDTSTGSTKQILIK